SLGPSGPEVPNSICTGDRFFTEAKHFCPAGNPNCYPFFVQPYGLCGAEWAQAYDTSYDAYNPQTYFYHSELTNIPTVLGPYYGPVPMFPNAQFGEAGQADIFFSFYERPMPIVNAMPPVTFPNPAKPYCVLNESFGHYMPLPVWVNQQYF